MPSVATGAPRVVRQARDVNGLSAVGSLPVALSLRSS